MRVYESTFILSPQADDAAFDQQIKSVSDLISRHKGKLLDEDRWGIRRLAYPIQKFTQGFFARIVFEGNNDVLSELERFYRLEEPFIRHLTVVFDGELEEVEKPSAPRDFPKAQQSASGDTWKAKPREEKSTEIDETPVEEKSIDEPVEEKPPVIDETPVEEKPIDEPAEEKSPDMPEKEKPADDSLFADTIASDEKITDVEPADDNRDIESDDRPEDKEL